MRTHLSRIEDYPAFLEACWQEHLKAREPDAPTVISLFAGCGGSSLGYGMAGYRELQDLWKGLQDQRKDG
jgi:hypothetical protein